MGESYRPESDEGRGIESTRLSRWSRDRLWQFGWFVQVPMVNGMAEFTKHCDLASQRFGKPYEEIHKWLDEFYGVEPYRSRHRRVRHHEQGIKEAVKVFGEYAEGVARQHIIIDLREDGWKESDHFPEDEQDYVKMGLW